MSPTCSHIHKRIYHSRIFLNSSGETWKQETHQCLVLVTLEMLSPSILPLPLCTPKTLAPPPPPCPASASRRPDCSPKRGCPGVGLPVGTRRLARLGGIALPPGGSRWSAKVVKYREAPMPSDGNGRKANKGHNFCTSGEKILFPTLIKHSLKSWDAKKTAISTNLFTVFAHTAGPLS